MLDRNRGIRPASGNLLMMMMMMIVMMCYTASIWHCNLLSGHYIILQALRGENFYLSSFGNCFLVFIVCAYYLAEK